MVIRVEVIATERKCKSCGRKDIATVGASDEIFTEFVDG
jgi:hypothetical protein